MEDDADDAELDLSEEDLRDVVVAYRTLNRVDAAFKQEVLENVGIPNVLEGGNLPFGDLSFAQVQILVPRKLLENACLILEQAAEPSNQAGGDNALNEIALEEYFNNTALDPEETELFEIRARNPGPQDEPMAVYLAAWIYRPLDAGELARRLALAGMNREDALGLVVWLFDKRGDLLAQAQEHLRKAGEEEVLVAERDPLLRAIGEAYDSVEPVTDLSNPEEA